MSFPLPEKVALVECEQQPLRQLLMFREKLTASPSMTAGRWFAQTCIRGYPVVKMTQKPYGAVSKEQPEAALTAGIVLKSEHKCDG
jgi:hypothetical protein